MGPKKSRLGVVPPLLENLPLPQMRCYELL